MGAPYFYLREDERVLQRLRAAPAYAIVLLVTPVLFVTLLLVVALLVLRFFPATSDVVPEWAPWAGWGTLLLLFGLAAWRRAATTEYALTDARIYARHGRLVTSLHFTTHDKVTDIRYRQGPLERAFGLASITFATAGGEVHIPGVRDAIGLKAAAETARDAFVRTLVAQAPRAERAAPAPAGPQPDATRPPPAPREPLRVPAWGGPRPDYLQAGEAPVWYVQPRLVASVGALRSLLGLLPILIFSNLLQGPQRLYIPIVALGFVLMLIASRLMQLRRTEYVATQRRVYARRGLIGTTVSQLTYDKITDITYTQDLLGRAFGYGTVTLQTAGGTQAPISMIGLAKPLIAKETIEHWRDASLEERA